MSVAFMGFSFMIWVLGIGLDSAYSGVVLQSSSFNALVQFSIFREAQVDLLFLSFSFPVPNTAWFAAIGDVVTWNQGMFDGWANWIRVPILLSLSAAFVGPLIVMLFSAILSRR